MIVDNAGAPLRPSDMRAIRSFRMVAMINANDATPSTACA